MKNENDPCLTCDKCHKVNSGKTFIHKNEGNGKIKVALIFSCPGAEEEQKKRPVAGATGKNLEELLKLLTKEVIKIDDSNEANTICRYDFKIVNAWHHVIYKSASNRSEATDTQIISKENCNRIIGELDEINSLICFGKKAKIAIKHIKEDLKENIIVIYLPHLGFRSVNQIAPEKVIEPSKKRTENRIRMICDCATYQQKQSNCYLKEKNCCLYKNSKTVKLPKPPCL
jgi:hypothetical protein